MTLTIQKQVLITTQPSNVGVCATTSATLQVSATGDGLTYQWYKGTSPSGAIVTGATSSNLQFSSAAVSDAGQYYVIVGGASQCASATSNAASLVVNQQIDITTQPLSQTICTGGSVSFSVVANGTISGYQWRKDGAAIPGEVGATITITGLTTANNGSYDVVISGPGSVCSSSTSAAAILTVDPTTVAGTVTGGTTVCSGTNSTVLTLGAHTGNVIRWESSPDNFATGGTPIVNTTNIFTAINLATTTSYRAVVRSGVCSEANSVSTTITVDPPTVPGTVSGGLTVCSGSNSTVLTLGGYTGNVVRWESSLDNFATAGNPITNTGNTYTAANLTATTSYRAVIQNGVCAPANSTASTVTVDPVTVPGAVTGGGAVCTGSNSRLLTLTGYTGNVVRWESSLDNFATAGTAIVNTANTYTATNLSATTYYRAVVQSGVCSTTNSTSATISVDPATVPGTVNGGVTVCPGTNSTVLTLSGQTGNVVRWESSLDNFATAGTAIANTSNTYTATNLSATTSYRAVVQSGVCGPANSISATVAMDPATVPGTVTGGVNVCTGTNSTVLTLGPHTGNVIRWESSLDNFATAGTTIPNNSNTYTATNLTATTSYRAVVQSGACGPLNSGASTVTVDPATVAGTVSGGVSVCTGTNSTVLTLGVHTGNVIRWESSLDNFATPGTAIANTANTYTAINLTASTSYRAVVQSGSCAAANSVAATVAVDALAAGGTALVAGSPAAAIKTICTGTGGSVSVSGSTGTLIRWDYSTDGGQNWQTTGSNANPYSFSTLSQTTLFRAAFQNGACTTNAYSTIAIVSVIPQIPPDVPVASPANICLGSSSTLGVPEAGYPAGPFADGSFNTANPQGWRVDLQSTGSFLPADGDKQDQGPWRETNDHAFSGVYYNSQDGKFAIANGPYNSVLETPVFSTLAMTSAQLQFREAYILNAGASAVVEISTDGGSNYNPLFPLKTYTVPSNSGAASYTNFGALTIDLTNYLGQSNLRIRFRYSGNNGSAWVLDDIRVTTPPFPITYQWSPTTYMNPANGVGATVIVTPPAGTYTYSVTTAVNGCPGGTSTAVTVTVKEPPSITTQPPASVAVCVGTSASITAGYAPLNVATPTWQISKNGGATWTNINAGTDGGIYTGFNSTTLNIKMDAPVTVATVLSMIDYQYRLTASNLPCGAANSSAARLLLKHVWVGTQDREWDNANNWAAGVVPDYFDCPDVYILDRTNDPILGQINTTIGKAFNLRIMQNADLTLINGTGNNTGPKLGIKGHIFKNPVSTFTARNGTVEMNGGVQNIDALTFTNNALGNLIVDNSGTLTLNGDLDIYESVEYGAIGNNLATNNFLTLKSLPGLTARMGVLSGKTISGQVTVERYLHARSAWRFLSVPTYGSGQTIHQAWQENKAPTVPSTPPGYGTNITGPTYPADGFDEYSQRHSMKYFDPNAFDGYTVVPNTGGAISQGTPLGYMVFVRGDRTVINGAGPTTLRTKGLLYRDNFNFTVDPLIGWNSVGNPYASRINLKNIVYDGSYVNAFTVWNPDLGGLYGVGGFETYTFDGADYRITPGGAIRNYIESGQAFYIQSNLAGIGTLKLTEAVKTSGSSDFSFAPNNDPELRVDMIAAPVDQRAYLADGILLNFNKGYERSIDNNDVKKLSNPSENLAVFSGNNYLVAERTALPADGDTIHLALYSAKQQAYRFNFIPAHLDKLKVKAYLFDKYLQTYQPISMNANSSTDFTVGADEASRAIDRFMIVFRKVQKKNILITEVRAGRKQDRTIAIDWKVENESGVQQYEIERSGDGVLYKGIITLDPTSNNSDTVQYTQTDIGPLPKENYYRVKVTLDDGAILYSNVVKVDALPETIVTAERSIRVFPNPVSGKRLQVVFTNQAPGKYQLQVINQLGQVVQNSTVNVQSDFQKQLIQLRGSVLQGQYRLNIITADGTITQQTFFVE
jgi:hypothetical protein